MDTRLSDDVAARQLKDVHLWLAAIVDSSDDAVISKNLDGVILTWNPAAERLFGYSEEEAVGQPITIIIPPELRDEENGILRRLRAGERIDHHETRRITRNGQYLEVSLTISPVRDAEGTIVGASKILRDVTESKRAQRALRESEQRLANEVLRARMLQAIITRLIDVRTLIAGVGHPDGDRSRIRNQMKSFFALAEALDLIRGLTREKVEEAEIVLCGSMRCPPVSGDHAEQLAPA